MVYDSDAGFAAAAICEIVQIASRMASRITSRIAIRPGDHWIGDPILAFLAIFPGSRLFELSNRTVRELLNATSFRCSVYSRFEWPTGL